MPKKPSKRDAQNLSEVPMKVYLKDQLVPVPNGSSRIQDLRSLVQTQVPVANYSGWDQALPLDMDWISHDWPYAVFDEDHLILWKKVRLSQQALLDNDRDLPIKAHMSMLSLQGDHRTGWGQLQKKMFLGALHCPYRIGNRIQPHGEGNWLLSPLGAMKERYGQLPFLLASLLPIKHLRMRKDQVLASEKLASVLPVAVWGQGWFLNEVSKMVETESFSVSVISHWLDQPNAFGGYIDMVELMMRKRFNRALPKNWHTQLYYG
jgi:hypothetical protein